jgi:uncharacterized protein
MPKGAASNKKTSKKAKELDFISLLNTNIRDLELRKSLKKLGQIEVIKWDFKSVLPAIKKTANTEVDLRGFLKWATEYKVLDWDARGNSLTESVPPKEETAEPLEQKSEDDHEAEFQEISNRLRNFLQYTVVNLISEPKHAHIKVRRLGPRRLRFKVILVAKDVVTMIGRDGATASAIRNILRTCAEMDEVHVVLKISSHEDEALLSGS